MKRQAMTLLVGALIAATLAGCTLFGPGTRAVIRVDVTQGTVPLTIAFDGSESMGPDGISTYHWEFGTGDETYDAAGTYTYTRAGTFTLRLTVRAENGASVKEDVTVVVSPAVWLTDETLDCVYRLSMSGALLDTFPLPVKEPRGVTIAVVDGQSTLVLACANEGFQKIVYLDPVTGATRQILQAPAQSPQEITFGATGQKALWHVDGQSRMIYRLNPESAQVFESYGQFYFKASSPQVVNVPFLRTPSGLDWVAVTNSPGVLYYLEGDTRVLWKIKMIAGYDIMANTQLQIEGLGVELPAGIFPVRAIDVYGDKLWAIDIDRHRLVEIDLATGALTGASIQSFPGSAPAGLEIQF